ncbi:hypothetical protein, partial [Klebsiella aerogenes]|uniref:hypothetical protein n=1 Tax=Klebsiella aerogenes TaxID=548 RepID=UPI001CC7A411
AALALFGAVAPLQTIGNFATGLLSSSDDRGSLSGESGLVQDRRAQAAMLIQTDRELTDDGKTLAQVMRELAEAGDAAGYALAAAA